MEKIGKKDERKKKRNIDNKILISFGKNCKEERQYSGNCILGQRKCGILLGKKMKSIVFEEQKRV